jgi:hypothetical protein
VPYGVSVALLALAWRWLARRREKEARAGLEWRQAADRRPRSDVA